MGLTINYFTFNPFEENTYVISNDKNECIIIDPGCYDKSEQGILTDSIKNAGLTPVRLLNTHCHIDHILGNAFVAKTFNIGLEIHKGELPVLHAGVAVAGMYGVPYEASPEPVRFLETGEDLVFGGTSLKILFTPGHSPASLCFYNAADGWLIGGDVLFYESIGRTDLPGGHYETLIRSIQNELFTLPEETIVYPGHGPQTTIGHEKLFNPFLN